MTTRRTARKPRRGLVADWPKLPEVRQWSRFSSNADDDAIISSALAAAIDFGNRRTNYLYDPTIVAAGAVPEMVHERVSCTPGVSTSGGTRIDGALVWGDSGLIRIGRADPDITAMSTQSGRWSSGDVEPCRRGRSVGGHADRGLKTR